MDQQHKPGETFLPTNNGPSNSEPAPDNSSTRPSPQPEIQPAAASHTPQQNQPATTPVMQSSDSSIQSAPTPGPVQGLPTPPAPQPQTQPTAQVNQAAEQRPKVRSKKGRTLIAAIIGTVFLASSAAYAYFGYYLPNQPENVVKAMLANTLTAKTSKSAGELVFNNDQTDIILNISSASDLSDIQNPQFLSKLSVDAGVTDVLFDLILVEKEVYFKIDGLNGLSSLLESQLGESAESYTSIVEAMDGIFGHWFVINESVVKEAVDFSQLSQEEIDQLMEAAKDVEFFEIVEVLPDEEVRGESTHHYTLRPNDDGLKAFLDNVKGKTVAGEEITDEAVEDIKRQIDENPTEDGDTFEVWVYKDSKRLAKVFSESQEEEISGTFSVEFFDYDEPVTINVPDEPKSLLELTSLIEDASQDVFGSLFQASGSLQSDGVQVRARDTERRTDINSIATRLELHYLDFGYYPADITGSQLTDLGLDPQALIDPNNNTINNGGYTYQPAQCDNSECESFTLSTELESEDVSYTKQSLN